MVRGGSKKVVFDSFGTEFALHPVEKGTLLHEPEHLLVIHNRLVGVVPLPGNPPWLWHLIERAF